MGGGGQDFGGEGSQVKDRWVGVRGKSRMFEKVEELVDWCGASNIVEEEVLGEVSGWV